jgi:hypothetical protein
MLREHAKQQEDAMGEDTDALVRFFQNSSRRRGAKRQECSCHTKSS